MPTYTTTTKHALRKLTGSNLVSDIDAGFAALADDLDAIIARADHGPASSRPTSTGGSPGKLGRFYRSDDTGAVDFDFGTGWVTVYQAVEEWKTVGADAGATSYQTNIGAGSSNAGAYSATDSLGLRYRKNRGRGQIMGQFHGGQNAAGTVIGIVTTLPAAYWPAANVQGIYGTRISTGAPASIKVDTTGVVWTVGINAIDVWIPGFDYALA